MNLRSLRFPILFSLPVAVLSSAAFAAPIPATSNITAATVYFDRAILTRQASGIEVPAGTVEIAFDGLPQTLLPESVQVSAKGTTAASILDITTRKIFTAAEPDARIKALEDQLTALRNDGRALADKIAVLGTQRTLLGQIEKASTSPVAAPAGSVAPQRPSLDDYEKLLGFSATQRTRLDAEAQKLDREQLALSDKIAAIENQLNELRVKQPGRRANNTVTVRLATTAAGKLDVALSYTLPGASWTPAYDARLRSEKRQVQLDTFGNVRNSTGEDWSGIVLTLSTARPSLGGAAPQIAPWLVDVPPQTTYNKGYASSAAFDRSVGSVSFDSKKPKRPDPSFTILGPDAGLGGGSLGDTFAAPAAPPPPVEVESTIAIAEIGTAATSATFKIATPVTLASDNTPQRVPLGSATLAADLHYNATPKLQENAYLAAYVTNRSDLPFLAGSLNVFLDDTFVATSRLTTTMPGEKFTLNLGADEGLSIKRKIVSRFTEDTGFTTRSRRTTYDILVTVINNKRTLERIVITDAAPVARDEKITVKLLAPTERELLKPEDAAVQPPKAGIGRDAEGKITWRLDLKPGEKREIPFKFTIEHPADISVTGVE